MFSTKTLNSVSRTVVVLVACFGVAGVSATTYYVNDDCGNDSWNGTSPNCQSPNGPKKTIQAGIDVCTAAGDAVEVAPGTYTGANNYDLHFNGIPIGVYSPGCDPDNVIIDCQGLGCGFKFIDDEDSSYWICGFTITHGTPSGVGNFGGGILCGDPGFFDPTHGSPDIYNCVIRDCSAQYGGGMSCRYGSNPYLENVTFESNTASNWLNATYGGGVYAHESSPLFVGCRFYDNSTTHLPGAGGGVYLETSASQFTECIFADNTTGGSGAGVCANAADPDFDYCTFYGNSAGSQGGGFYCTSQFTTPTFENCTFYGNQAIVGGSIAAVNYAHPTLQRSIICNGGEAAYCQNYSTVTITCCDVWANTSDGCVAGQIGSNNNFAADPAFCDQQDPNYVLTIRAGSPCAPANSPCGQLVGAWDVGCSGSLTHYVCPTGPADYTTIQPAIDAAFSGDTIVLCDATYTGDGNRDLDFDGKDLYLHSESGDPNLCIIDCAADETDQHRGFNFHSGETSAAIIEGVTITNGYSPDWPGGGGILCRDGSSPTVRYCRLEHNHTEHEGGGLMARDSAPTVHDCLFRYNSSAGIGGGMNYGYGGPYTLLRCVFQQNFAHDDGGGLGNFSPVAAEDCQFIENHTEVHGGGVTCMGEADGSTFLRCGFSRNMADGPSWNAGGGLSSFVDGLVFESCTFNDNNTSGEGGGVYFGDEGSDTFTNCTFYGNGAPTAGGIQNAGGVLESTIIAFGTMGQAMLGPATLTCCDVFGNAGGPGSAAAWIGTGGNIAMDPMFCGAPAEDFTLHCDSPCAPFSAPNPECDLIGAWPVDCGYQVGDMNCDGSVDFGDINPFVKALTDPAGYAEEYPDCDIMNGDINGDDVFDFGDINPFVDLLSG